MNNEKMRDQFESWYLEKYCGGEERLKKCHNDAETYYYSGVQAMWVPWQASRASIEIDLPSSKVPQNIEVIKAVGRHILLQGLKVNP